MTDLALYVEQPDEPEVLTGEVMEGIIVVERCKDWHDACVFKLHEKHYFASMGSAMSMWGSGVREPTIFEALSDGENWFQGDEVFEDRGANSKLGLIYLFERSKEKEGSYHYSTHSAFQSDFGRGGRIFFDPSIFKGQTINIKLDKDGNIIWDE